MGVMRQGCKVIAIVLSIFTGAHTNIALSCVHVRTEANRVRLREKIKRCVQLWKREKYTELFVTAWLVKYVYF